MKFEHFGINVPDSNAMADWYVQHCGMQIVRKIPSENQYFGYFMADETGRVLMEIYTNLSDPIPDYEGQHPLRFHIAFVSDQPEAKRDELIKAGATVFAELRDGDGTCVINMRDPWGMPLQLCKRAEPF